MFYHSRKQSRTSISVSLLEQYPSLLTFGSVCFVSSFLLTVALPQFLMHLRYLPLTFGYFLSVTVSCVVQKAFSQLLLHLFVSVFKFLLVPLVSYQCNHLKSQCQRTLVMIFKQGFRISGFPLKSIANLELTSNIRFQPFFY